MAGGGLHRRYPGAKAARAGGQPYRPRRTGGQTQGRTAGQGGGRKDTPGTGHCQHQVEKTFIQLSNPANSQYFQNNVNLYSTFFLRYGTDPHKERARVARHALRSLADRVWEREAGRAGGRWSGRDQALMRTGQGGVPGWELEPARPVLEYPELAGDVDNIHVVRTKKHGRH